ncbi:MAG TPA: proton-conducting transporter membrane subunit [Labilithrix sp.]|jgi:hydrogenase-4 component B|nr:proton-conducting transporter membrane subunit [Labilithrix sp.]
MSWIVLLSAVLAVGALLALALPRNGLRAWASIGTQFVASALAAPPLLGVLRSRTAIEGTLNWSYPIEIITLRIDSLSAFFLAWSLPMTLLGSVYAVGYLKPYFAQGRNGGPQFALLNMTSLAFVVVYSAQNALVFLLGWEIAAVAAWLMVIWDYRNQKIRFAGFNYLISTHIGLFVLVAAFMLMYAQTGSMDFGTFGVVLSKPGRLRGVAFLLLGVSCALKSAFFPFHTWLPRAHSAAPAHVSALMSGVIHKAGLFAFLRFLLLVGRPEEWMGWAVLVFGAFSAFFGVLYTSAQRDMKRLLGYSSTENVGIAAMGFGVGCLGMTWGIPSLVTAGFAGGLLHLLNHGIFKCLLFYAAGAVYRATHTVDLERLGGLLRRLPSAGWLFLLGGIAISALPPLNGFVSEVIIYSGLLSGTAPSPSARAALVAMAALLAFVGAVSALSTVRAFGVAFLGSPRDTSVHVSSSTPLSMNAPMVVHALAAGIIGLFPLLGLAAARAPAALFAVDGKAWGDAGLVTLLSPIQIAVQGFGALVFLTCAFGWLVGRRSRAHVTWACGYTAPNTRMQYTASSFSAEFARFFGNFLPELRKKRLSREIFPQEAGHLATHHVDAVERRMFEVLGQGEQMIQKTSAQIPEQPRFAFAAGLVALVVVVGILLGGGAR